MYVYALSALFTFTVERVTNGSFDNCVYDKVMDVIECNCALEGTSVQPEFLQVSDNKTAMKNSDLSLSRCFRTQLMCRYRQKHQNMYNNTLGPLIVNRLKYNRYQIKMSTDTISALR